MGVAGGAHLESCANALQCLCDHGKMGAKLPETAYLEFSQRGIGRYRPLHNLQSSNFFPKIIEDFENQLVIAHVWCYAGALPPPGAPPVASLHRS
jgi:hypothetical protein